MAAKPTQLQLAAVKDPVVRELASHGQFRALARNTIFINEADDSDTLFFILSGKVKVFSADESGREIVHDIIGVGEYIGEMALDGEPRSASVMTLEPTTCAVLTRDEVRSALAANPDIAINIISTLIARARLATGKVRNLALLDVYGRLARLLLDLAEERDGMLVITERLTRQEIGERIGASRDMVTRIFKDLVAGGYIKIEDKAITILRAPPERW
jgi:CRP/FNR family transcriptional regulator, cyclic AMP receptor protein